MSTDPKAGAQKAARGSKQPEQNCRSRRHPCFTEEETSPETGDMVRLPGLQGRNLDRGPPPDCRPGGGLVSLQNGSDFPHLAGPYSKAPQAKATGIPRSSSA